MLQVLGNSWALFLGMLLLMIGNGLQGSLLGVRGALEGFGTGQMSVIMAAYFGGFLFASRLVPRLIRRVGHVRVFAALASFISAVLILFPTLATPVLWSIERFVLGFCFCGVYVVAESWLNNDATNENRGSALSLYMFVQMAGVVAAQGLLAIGDPAGFVIFIIPSVLVSLSFAPILLSISPTPAFESSKPMKLKDLFGISPLGCVGMFLLGGVFAAQFGMAAVFGSLAGLSVPQISSFVAAIYIGALLAQFPIGWLSDRMDRRTLILIAASGGGIGGLVGAAAESFTVLLLAGGLIGAMSNPLYALLIAYTNDSLEPDDMAAASGGLLFINGCAAVVGPIGTGWLMQAVGPSGFFYVMSILLFGLAGYAGYRMAVRPPPATVDETTSYAPILPTASPVAVEVAQEVFIEAALEEEGAEPAQ